MILQLSRATCHSAVKLSRRVAAAQGGQDHKLVVQRPRVKTHYFREPHCSQNRSLGRRRAKSVSGSGGEPFDEPGGDFRCGPKGRGLTFPCGVRVIMFWLPENAPAGAIQRPNRMYGGGGA